MMEDNPLEQSSSSLFNDSSVTEIKEWISNKLIQLEKNNQILKEENKKVNEELIKLKERYVNNNNKRIGEQQQQQQHNNNNNQLGLGQQNNKKKCFTPEVSRRYNRGKHYHRFNRIQQQYTSSSSSSSSSSSLSSSSDDDVDNENNTSSVGVGNNIRVKQKISHSQQCSPRKFKLSKSSSLDRKLKPKTTKRTTTTTTTKKKTLNFDRTNNNNNNNKLIQNNGKGNCLDLIKVNQDNNIRNNEDEDDDDEHHHQEEEKDNGNVTNNKPPTPPLHRMPSWESRIYEIANNGIQSAISTPIEQHRRKLDFTNNTTSSSTIMDNNFIIDFYGNHNNNNNRHLDYYYEEKDSTIFNNHGHNNNDYDYDYYYSKRRFDSTMMNNDNNQHNRQQTSDNKIIVGSELNHCSGTSTTNNNIKTVFKSSTTSSGNESDSTTTVAVDKQTTNNTTNNNTNPFLFDDINNYLLDDSFDKLKLTSSTTSTTTTPTPNNTTSNDKLEKSGYLFKLSGKFKVWKKRYFILKDGNLYYFKRNQSNNLNDNNLDNKKKKIKGKIILDQNCSLIRRTTITNNNNNNTNNKEYQFHLSYQDGKKLIHLKCDSFDSYMEWLRLIGQTLTINNILKLQDNQVPIIENYLFKVRYGHSLKCWTALYNNNLVYFNNPFEKIPIGYTNLKECQIKEITSSSVPDFEDVALIYEEYVKKNLHYSISIHPKNDVEPIYLVFLAKQDFSLWYYHLKLAFNENNIPRTAFENLLTSLLNIESTYTNNNNNNKDEFYKHEIWMNPLLTYTNDNELSEPLTSIHNDQLKQQALKLFKSINLFITVSINVSAIDYHITLIQNCLQVCFDYPELQPELYFQLIKQSSPNQSTQTPLSVVNLQTKTFWCSPHNLFKCESSSPPELFNNNNNNDNNNVSEKNINLINQHYLQCLKFLSIAISIFLPQNQVLWLLKHHINRFKSEQTELGKYFLYCERALSRVLLNGPRRRIPSRMEVLSIIQRNPYDHSMPHSIPVHFPNDSYQVIGFDGSTTVAEFTNQINRESGIRDNLYSGFALYSDDPIEKHIEHLLDPSAILADAISYWETTLRKYNLGKFDQTKIIKLSYKHRLCLKKHFKTETDKERLIWIYEINNEIINNRFPVTFDLAIELMSLMIQIEYGNQRKYSSINNNNDNNSNLEQIIQKCLFQFLPTKFHEQENIKQIIMKRWSELEDRSILDCVRIYLNCTRKWNHCGGQLFQAKIYNCLKYDDLASLYLYKFFLKYPLIWIAINEDYVDILEYETFRSILQISYRNLLNFGSIKSLFTITIDHKCLQGLIKTSNDTTSGKSSIRQSMFDKHRNQQKHQGQCLFFKLPEDRQITKITTLISDYIETKKHIINTEI